MCGLLGLGVLLGGTLSPTGTGGILLGGEGDLVQHELWDWVGEGGGHGQQGRIRLITVLIGDKLDHNISAVRGGVAVGRRLWVSVFIIHANNEGNVCKSTSPFKERKKKNTSALGCSRAMTGNTLISSSNIGLNTP